MTTSLDDLDRIAESVEAAPFAADILAGFRDFMRFVEAALTR